MKTIELKLANMRKPQSFVNYGVTKSNTVIIQSNKAIGEFNILTGKGVLNTKGCYFPHLTLATPYTLSIAEVALLRDAVLTENEDMFPNSGLTITSKPINVLN